MANKPVELTACSLRVYRKSRADASSIRPQFISTLGQRESKMKTLKIFGISLGSIAVVGLIGLVILGSLVPETYVYLGRQIPKKYLSEIRSLGLLAEDEKIKYFYTDAFLDIKEGMYFVTDQNLVLYSSAWEVPETMIPLEQIASIEVQYDDSFFEDTSVFVTTQSGMEVSFPVSSEKGRDRKFIGVIQEELNVE